MSVCLFFFIFSHFVYLKQRLILVGGSAPAGYWLIAPSVLGPIRFGGRTPLRVVPEPLFDQEGRGRLFRTRARFSKLRKIFVTFFLSSS